MSLESNSRRVFVAVVLAALVALPAVSEEATKAPEVADMTTGPGSIAWAPRIEFDKLVLTVKGGGHTLTSEFRGGRPSFAPVDPEGYLLPDGTYSWELTVIPRALDANNHHFRSDEPSADGRSFKAGTTPEGRVQSGSFTIANGAIVDPTPVEPESRAAPQPEAAAAEVDDSDAANQ